MHEVEGKQKRSSIFFKLLVGVHTAPANKTRKGTEKQYFPVPLLNVGMMSATDAGPTRHSRSGWTAQNVPSFGGFLGPAGGAAEH